MSAAPLFSSLHSTTDLESARKVSKSSKTAFRSLMIASTFAAAMLTMTWVPSARSEASATEVPSAKPEVSPKPSTTPQAASENAQSSNGDPSGVGATDKSAAATDKPSVPGEPPVLDPNKFFGHAKSGYAAAQLCPEICAKLFCYCGCDMTDDHDSLLDCFTTDHGVDCHICQEEALIALKMKREGKTMKQIQQAIDIMFEKEYPFDDPSAVIQKYRKNRLWQPGTLKSLGKSGSVLAKPGTTQAGKANGKSSQSAGAKSSVSASGKPLLGKNGQPVGACCAGHSKDKK